MVYYEQMKERKNHAEFYSLIQIPPITKLQSSFIFLYPLSLTLINIKPKLINRICVQR